MTRRETRESAFKMVFESLFRDDTIEVWTEFQKLTLLF